MPDVLWVRALLAPALLGQKDASGALNEYEDLLEAIDDVATLDRLIEPHLAKLKETRPELPELKAVVRAVEQRRAHLTDGTAPPPKEPQPDDDASTAEEPAPEPPVE